MRKALTVFGGVLILAIVAFLVLAPGIVDKRQNQNLTPVPLPVDAGAAEVHERLIVVDWHADTLLWNRNMFRRHERGHVDLPRLLEGNMALQVFTVVSKVPRGINYDSNEAGSDLITPLAIAQRWPIATWSSLKARAVYQAGKLDRFVDESDGSLRWVRNRAELDALLSARAEAISNGQQPPVGALLGMEGAHPHEGRLENVEEFYELGYRMIGLTHFFDNGVSGSLHGIEQGGLTPIGRQLVRRMNELGIIIDISHASRQAVNEILELSSSPVVLSHGGMKGTCDSARNLPDELMKAVAGKGGLLAMGFWDGAICDPSPEGIAETLVYAVKTLGEDHVALGSDWDGTISSIDAASLPAITEALLAKGMSEDTIAKVMGGNSIAFLRQWLPQE